MKTWLEERVHRLKLSVDRLEKATTLVHLRAGPSKELDWLRDGQEKVESFLLRKESTICLKRALAVWWGLRWGGVDHAPSGQETDDALS